MSFFSRLSNLVSGFSHGLLNRIEDNNPELKQAQRKQDIAKQNKELKEAAAGLLVLEKGLEAELPKASESRQAEIQNKIQEYQSQRKEMLSLISQNQQRKHTAGLSDVQNMLNQESAAEDSLGLLRARTEVLESMLPPSSSSAPSPKPPSTTSKEEEEDSTTEPKKRTL